MIKEIYLLRHGQTDFNKQKIIQGCGVDADLNRVGQQQAQSFFEYYQHIPFDHIYTSKLKRSIQSVQAFIEKGIPVKQLEGLNEIDWGVFEGKNLQKLANRHLFFQTLHAWENGDFHAQIPGGESPVEVANRQRAALKIIRQNQDAERILICMHGRAMRIFLCVILGLGFGEMNSFVHQNLGLYLLKSNGNGFELQYRNDTRHFNGHEKLLALP